MLRRSGRLAAAAATDLAAVVAHSASASMPEAKRARVKPAGARGRGARASPPAAGDRASEEAGAGAQVPAVRKREAQLYGNGRKCVIGIDEAGRGPLAGPVVTAACYLPMDVQLAGLTDSKLLDEAQRDALYDEIVSNPRIQFATCIISRERIDEINILAATMEGMARAARELAAKVPADYALVDGNRLPADMPCEAEAVVRGDLLCACISAASIVAKVTRDRIMLQLDKEFPQYGFAQHKGKLARGRALPPLIAGPAAAPVQATASRRTWPRFSTTARARTIA